MPQCRQVEAHPSCPAASEPSTDPRPPRVPAATEAVTGSYVERNPLEWSTDTTGFPATEPANTTMPSATASTGLPSSPENAEKQLPISLEWYAEWEQVAAEMYQEMLTE